MKKHIPLILVLILGTILRYYHNTLISLWHDEAFSALMIRYPWREMFYRLGLDVHPPAYYVALRLWHYVFGDSLLSLRSFSILFSTGSIWAAWLFTKEAFKNEQAALWAAVFIAINPFQLQYVTEARMYTFGAFFALLAGYFLAKALNRQKELYSATGRNMPNRHTRDNDQQNFNDHLFSQNKTQYLKPGNFGVGVNLPETVALKKSMVWAYVGFTLSMIVIIYTHYYLFFTAAALGFYGLVYLFFHHEGGWKKYRPIVMCYVLIVLSFLPWLKTFLFQYRQVGASYWIPPMDRWSIPSTFWDMLLGFARDTSKGLTQILLVIVLLFSLYLFYRFLKKTEGFAKWLVFLAVIAPFCGAILFAVLAHLKGSRSSVYLDRYFLFASVYYSIALVVWLKEINIKWLSVSLFIIYCIVNFVAYVHYWNDLDVYTKPGMSAAAKFLQFNAASGDKLYVGSSFMFFNLKYYWTLPGAASGTISDTDTGYHFISNVPPLLFTGGVTKASEISHYAGSALLADQDLLPDFKTAVHPGDTVWLVWTNGFGASKPETPLNWTQVDEHSYAEVRPYVGTYVYVTEYKVN